MISTFVQKTVPILLDSDRLHEDLTMDPRTVCSQRVASKWQDFSPNGDRPAIQKAQS